MGTIQDNYEVLLRKLDEFTRKYYINQLIRGAIYTGALLLGCYLVIGVLEYFFYFSSVIRAILFFGFLITAMYIFMRFIAIPLGHYFRLGKLISHEQAAAIIGSHFSNVQDRLLNVLQLKKQAGDSDSDLIEASINQKINALKPIPFSSAINLSVNRKYLRYLVLPLMALLFILFASPNLLRESTFRLLHHQEYFERKAPFRFQVLNEELQTVQYRDYELKVEVEGEAVPNDAVIVINGFQYPLKKEATGFFSYTIIKPQADVPFHFSANGFRSRDFMLNVLPKPIIARFQVELDYPAYVGKPDETVNNLGDITVPEGTKIDWQFFTEHATEVTIRFGEQWQRAAPAGDNDVYQFELQAKEETPYTVYLSGAQLPQADSMGYLLQVLPDRFPSIVVNQVLDSTDKKYLYFAGEASDDYGLRNLVFKYKIDDNQTGNQYESVPVTISKEKMARFSHYWDLHTLPIKPGDQVTYFFEVWDNDGVNGSKFTRSQVMTLTKPTEAELEKQTDKTSQQIKEDLESSMKEAELLKKEYAKLENELLNKKNPSWEDKKKIEDLLKRQQQLNQTIEQIQNTFRENLENQEEYNEFSEETMQKAEQLEKLMNEVLTPEMQEMMKKLEELLEQLNKDKTLDQLQDQKMNNEELRQELDRMLALFKQLEFEKKMQDTRDKLQELAGEQEALSGKTEQADKKQSDSLAAEQESLEKKFEEAVEDIRELDEMNRELEHPNEMPDTKSDQQQAREEMKEAKENLGKQNNKKAGENQKNAAQEMKEMSEKMNDAMQSMQMQQMEMDLQATRQILENLIKVSFDQEDLINRTKGVNVYNPQYLQLMKEQKDVEDDLEMVKDSIQELSKRVFEIQKFVTEQVNDINSNMDKALKSLEQRQTAAAASHQQYVMTGVNNLALMFNEVLEQMQQQMSQQMAGSQMCQKPGGKKQNQQSMSQMQQQLNDRIQKMGEMMKQGKLPKDGQGMSKEIAEMAQQQAQIREAIRQMNEELNKDGKNALGDLNKLQKEMEKTETELLNKQLTAEMMKRQKEILTRLLEAENAERQRETDQQREAREGKDMVRKLPPQMEEYLKKKEAEMELYKTVPPELKPFYRELVEEYYKSLQQ